MDILLTVFITAGLTWVVVSILFAGKESDAESKFVFALAEKDAIIRALENELIKHKDLLRSAVLEAHSYKNIISEYKELTK